MARTKELNYSVVITVNMGNYESVKIEVGESVEIEKDDSPEDVKKEKKDLMKRVNEQATHQADKLRKARDAIVGRNDD